MLHASIMHERPPKVTYNGKEYVYKDTHRKQIRYRCAHYRSGCKASLGRMIEGGEFKVGKHEHECEERETIEERLVDVTDEFLQKVHVWQQSNNAKRRGRFGQR